MKKNISLCTQVMTVVKESCYAFLLGGADDVRTSLMSISDLNWFRIVHTW